MKLQPVQSGDAVRLRDRDAAPPKGLPDEEELKRRTARLCEKLGKLQEALFAESRQSLLVVFQARDAGGKDGAIKKVFGPLNPQGCGVTSFNVPTEDELARDFLWRVHMAVPEKGHIGLWNRSHYEDVLVVRVKELVPPRVWKKRYRQINDFERLLAETGTTILKFFLHISRDEQKQRLEERLADPTKQWKFRAGDLEVRQQWDAYNAAYRDALTKCSTPWAPWYVVPSDDKRVRDYLVARTVVAALEKMRPGYPPADPEVLALQGHIE